MGLSFVSVAGKDEAWFHWDHNGSRKIRTNSSVFVGNLLFGTLLQHSLRFFMSNSPTIPCTAMSCSDMLIDPSSVCLTYSFEWTLT
jgi:hypothetical protein